MDLNCAARSKAGRIAPYFISSIGYFIREALRKLLKVLTPLAELFSHPTQLHSALSSL